MPVSRQGLSAGFAAVLGGLLIATPIRAEVPIYGYEVVHTYPHDTSAFTEGLFYLGGVLYESTGGQGQSTIRKVRLADGVVLQSRAIDPNLFGEGIVNWGGQIISLTWRDQIGFRWNLKSFRQESSFRYGGEGWALTQDGKDIILSDGSPTLHFLEPGRLREVRHIDVVADGRPIGDLNELEWVRGDILANVWRTTRIARIDPRTGAVKAWIDLMGLPETLYPTNADAVLNGIAYDRDHDRLFITGKNWPHLYEIRLKPPAKAKS